MTDPHQGLDSEYPDVASLLKRARELQEEVDESDDVLFDRFNAEPSFENFAELRESVFANNNRLIDHINEMVSAANRLLQILQESKRKINMAKEGNVSNAATKQSSENKKSPTTLRRSLRLRNKSKGSQI